jgi:GT2 family glycosyltransferase
MERDGRAYVATRMGVQIFDRNGRVAAVLPLPGNAAGTSLCFGGHDFDTLYVASGVKVYRRTSTLGRGVGRGLTKGIMESYAPRSTADTRANLVVGIATRGRSAILAETIAFLAKQERQPDMILVAYAELADVGYAPERFPSVTFIQAELGLTRQRNAILSFARDCDILLFIDDDFYLDPHYLRIAERFFRENPEVAASHGRVLADDVKGPGLTVEQAQSILAGDTGAQCEQKITPTYFAYGCNMCLRMAPIREHGLRFDETLPLYGWYEDWDFSRQLAQFGAIVHISNACGVHLSVKVGRTTGVQMGYAQVANPIYLARKGTFPWSHVFRFIVGPCLKNLVRSLKPEAHVDRLGRFCGNLAAFRDLLTGTLSPMQITNL